MPMSTFSAGDEVIMQQYSIYGWRWGKVTKIKKVHKNGRITIQGDTVPNRTFRPEFYTETGIGWRSEQSAADIQGHVRVLKYTDALKERIAKEKAAEELERRAASAQRTVANIRPRFLTEEQVILMERIIEISAAKTVAA